MYHDVVDAGLHDSSGFPGPEAATYKVAPALFEAHLDAISTRGLDVGLVDCESHESICAFTFDDGGIASLDIADRIERRGYRGHFLVTTALLGTRGYLTKAQLVELADRGHSIGSHSHTHPRHMANLSQREIHAQWFVSRGVLGDLLGRPPLIAAAPGGSVSREVLDCALDAGYRVLFTSRPSSKARRHGQMLVRGRYTIWRSTGPRQAAAYAAGAPTVKVAAAVEYGAGQVARKILGPRLYPRIRAYLPAASHY